MEPFKIQVEVSLSDETLKALKAIACASIFSQLSPADRNDLEKRAFSDESKADQKTDAAPAPEVGDMPAEIADPVPAPAPAQADAISDDELAEATRKAVAELKRQGRPSKVIREKVFTKFGIKQSVDCPADQRKDFLSELDMVVNAF